MDKNDFQRIAPRYIDGATSAEETRAVQTGLLKDAAAQRQLELLSMESLWIGRAFARRPEDISRIVIRVRS